MNKTIKRLITTIAILSTIILFPNIVNSVEISNDTKVEGSNNKVGELLTIGSKVTVAPSIFNNKFIYCYEHNEDFFYSGNKEILVKEKYLISRDNVIKETSSESKTYTTEKIVKYAQGLAYILSNYNENVGATRKHGTMYTSKFDDIQLALWEYQYKVGDDVEIKKAFSIANTKEVQKNGKSLGYKSAYGEGYQYSNKWSTRAFEIYENASKIRLGKKKSSLNAEIYILTNNDYQNLLMLKKSTEEPTIPPVTLTFKKQDFSGNALSNAKFTVTAGENVKTIDGATGELPSGGSDGKFCDITVTPSDISNKTFTIKLKETATPLGYKKLDGEVTLTVGYDEKGNVTSITPTDYFELNGKDVIVKNKPILNLTIIKKDSLTTNPIKEVQFKIKLENIADIKGYHKKTEGKESSTTIAYLTTDEKGKIGLTGIVPEINNGTVKPITAEITEIKVPTVDGYYYKKLEMPIKITITYNSKTKKWETTKGTASGNTVTVDIENQPLIKLDGTVWQDAQTGNKLVTGPNGERDKYYEYERVEKGKGNYIVKDGTFEEVKQGEGNYIKKEIEETGLDGILVELYNVNTEGNIIGDKVASVPTKDGGKYEFADIPKTDNGYKVVFNYDGINYQETDTVYNQETGEIYNKEHSSNEEKNSDASESPVVRKVFNEDFETIVKGESEKNGVKLRYEYNNKISTLETTMDGLNPANENSPDFRMSATTNRIYKDTTPNIDCGLVKKEFDLAIGTDVKSARLEINDKSTTYSREQIMNGEIADLTLDEILEGKSSESEKPIYSLDLYKSDYNYRIEDYKKGNEAITNQVNPDDNKDNNYENLKELEAYVTYNVILKGQTTQTAKVNKFEYYYDSVYAPYNIDGKLISEEEREQIKNGQKVSGTGNNYEFEIEGQKITFTSRENTPNIQGPDYRVEVDLEFRVNKNTEGYVELKKDVKNIAEITEYSTAEGGLIDIDSAPGNGITNGAITQYEDDTDESKGINISVKEDKIRKITGTVFDDTKGEDDKYNGKKDDAEKPVNDVIVQLIEVKKISGNYYEYIWQETRSGSGNVKKMHGDGKTIEDKQYREAPNDGTYEFTGYIPGNYIIRYIYGDGTTYDITDNVKEYNGQDYKSTVDNKYKAQWYNTAGYEPEEGYSVARDNEARRLEVMAYSTTIDNVNGEALERRNKEDLSNTWMCAETSRINVPVDADNKNTDSSNTTVSYGYEGTIQFNNMNFGLAERPKTNLILEKHITGLKITPNGTGVQSIVDAKADIKDILDNGSVNPKGVTQGLATIMSTRKERGFWQVATDVEELAQGAELEVEYTYVIRNDSEKDYLSSSLINAYEDGCKGIKAYDETLKEIKDTVKRDMKNGSYSYNDSKIGSFLGQYYYTGEPATTDKEVESRIETLEEALNNSLTFDETSGEDFNKKTTTDEETMKTIFDTNGEEKSEKITTIIENAKPADILTPSDTKDKNGKQEYVNNDEKKTADYSKKVTLRTVLSSSTGGELGANLPSYIAEVVKYSNAAGRRDMDAEPANLSYVHSDDKDMTMDSVTYEKDGEVKEAKSMKDVPEGAKIIREANQRDEFWGETIIITKPTGEDKLTPIQIAIITVSSMAVLGVGIVLIKKFVLKK